jgi:hypothetical protein
MKYILFLSSLLAFASACKKKPIERPSVFGMWKAKYSLDTSVAPNLDVIYRVEKNGIIYVYNGNDTAKATEKATSHGAIISTGNGITTLYFGYKYPNNPNTTYYVEVDLDPMFKTFEGTWDVEINNTLTAVGKLIGTKL